VNKVIKPTIGRVVWFWSAAAAWQHPDAQPWAALVTHVWADDCVSLAAFDQNGDLSPQHKAYLWNGEGERPLGAHAEWMPYQKGQAAKVDVDVVALATKVLELESQLKTAMQMLMESTKAKAEPAPPPSVPSVPSVPPLASAQSTNSVPFPAGK
jgi:hypothetical protein